MKITVTPAQYAKFINRSLSTVYRRLSALARKNEARKRDGRWLILIDVRAWRAALVDQDRLISNKVRALKGWSFPAELRAHRENVHAALLLLPGGGDILLALAAAKMLVGVQGAKVRYRAALGEIDRLIAA